MAYRNRVDLIGNIGHDPEIRRSPEGTVVANLRLATTRRWKDKKSGEVQEDTEWHRLVAFDQLAEVAERYIHKGSRIAATGRLRTRKWQDKDGNDRYTTEVLVNEVQLLDRRADSHDGHGEDPADDDSPI